MATLQHPAPDELPGDARVLISGGGPSGLFLALDLASRGIASTVVEPRTTVDPARPRAKTTNARTMTQLRRLGLAEKLRDAAPLPVGYAQDVAFCTSLTGYELRRFHHAFQLVPGRYDPAPECGQQVPQPVLEDVLRDAVDASGLVTFITGWQVAEVAGVAEVVGVAGRADDGDTGAGTGAAYITTIEDGAGHRHSIRSIFVIGADGGSSTVRRSLGIRLEGGSAALSNLSIMFRSRTLGRTITLDPAVQYWVVGSRVCGMVGRMDLADTWWAIIQGVDESALAGPAAVDGEDAAAMVRDLAGADVDVQVLATDPWTARMLLAPDYGRGRVFLVGDAAHQNPPWGGHGFNTCISDAANLAWKIAAVLHGWAGPALLDSYGQERRPVAARTIRDAASNGEALTYHFADPALNEPGDDGDAARAAAHQSLAVKASEFDSLGLVLGYSYAGSPIVVPDGSDPLAEDPIRYAPSAQPGALLPHAWLDAETSLYSVLGEGFTLLVDEAVLEGTSAARAYAQVLAAGARAGIPVEVAAVGPAGDGTPMAQLWEADAVLVRPDQHVAWRGGSATDAAHALAIASGWGHQESANTQEPERKYHASAVIS